MDSPLLMKSTDNNQPMISTDKLLELENAASINKIYEALNLDDLDDEVRAEFGPSRAQKKSDKLKPIEEEEFFTMLKDDNRFLSILKQIKNIDIDNLGCVTIPELLDIFQLHYAN
jgi:hypothetical protein